MTKKEDKTPEPCFMCRQPTTRDYSFTVVWDNNGEEEKRHFCGSRCLRDWAENYSENIKMELYDPESEDPEMFLNVSPANLRTCILCGTQYAMTLQECPKCGEEAG